MTDVISTRRALDAEKVEAICAIVALADPFDARRRHRITVEGKPERHEQYIHHPAAARTHALVARDNERLQ